MKKIKQISVILIFMICGCTTSRVTTIWKAENIDFLAYRNVLVMALLHDSDSSLQENMEDPLVASLKELGYSAVSSVHEYGPNAFNHMNMQAVYGKITDSKMDAVITIVLLNKKEEVKFIPSSFYLSTSGLYYYNYPGYEIASANPFYNAGYYVTYTDYFWISGVYDVASKRLGYSLQMHSLNQLNTQLMAYEYGRKIVKNMMEHRVLSKKQNLRAF